MLEWCTVQQMKAEIVAIGTEILLGNILDTNTQFLASQLASLGIDLYFASSVGDNPERLTHVLKQAWGRSELVLTTGGLGPTEGDITRETIGAVLGEKPVVDEAIAKQIEAFFTQRRMTMSANNRKQAMLIPSARSIPNPIGTAPGWWVEKDGHILVVMPGPPGEMQLMWNGEVLPRLEKRTEGIILSRVVKTFGIAESKVDELLSELTKKANPTVATYAKTDGIPLGRSVDEIETNISRMAEVVARYTVGMGLLEILLSDDHVEDVYIDAPCDGNPIHLTLNRVRGHNATTRCSTNIVASAEEIDGFASRLRQYSNRPFSEAFPVLETDLEGYGSRATIIGYPLSPNGTAVALRRHSRHPWTLMKLVHNGTMDCYTAGWRHLGSAVSGLNADDGKVFSCHELEEDRLFEGLQEGAPG